MGAKSGAALKFLQWFNRAIQFGCAALVLGVYSYFLATLSNHNLHISTKIRAVEGISGVGALYTIIALLLLCCLAGFALTSFIAIILDVAFVGAFIYVAVANKHGASSCSGYLDTPFGRGQSSERVNGSGGFTALPSFRLACRLQTACLAVSIIAIFFFLFSVIVEVALVRHHRKEKRFGPSPHNNYTSGYAKGKGGFFNRIFRRNTTKSTADNTLPEHTTPTQLEGNRQSYGTERTAANAENGHVNQYGQKVETGYGHQNLANGHYQANSSPYPEAGAISGVTGTPVAPQNYRYEDGVYERP